MAVFSLDLTVQPNPRLHLLSLIPVQDSFIVTFTGLGTPNAEVLLFSFPINLVYP